MLPSKSNSGAKFAQSGRFPSIPRELEDEQAGEEGPADLPCKPCRPAQVLLEQLIGGLRQSL